MKRHQLPGRQEALRAVLRGDTAPEMRRIAGMGKEPQRQPARPMHTAIRFASGIESLAPAERAALPF